ncbi:pilus assembly protein PilZ [Salipaludibacillus keqinensis]|uniref:Pilus assembly protein PilZ n=1 Tax=Salipaludibacillus keqinensis TaxID=2045207 RepID=A0A323TI18_9BACI|nr:flagellar brake domain-containing protein [Salipaludibacillus keqinensis]PYZ94488.1 pilus assembly protein PilZ [Salipaludibacillus keqinensis]
MIKVGNTIHLELKSSDEEKRRYKSKILDYNESKIFIDYPVDKKTKKPHFFLEGTQFRVWFMGNDKAIYLFESEVLGKDVKKFPMLVLKDPGVSDYVRIQRRQYVRVDTTIDVAVHCLNNKCKPFTTVTADVSGGGMALVLPEQHSVEEKDVIKTWLALPYQSGEMIYLEVKAKTIRILKDRGRLKGSFEFVDLDDIERQKIVRYCFERQLTLKKKEKAFK